MIYEVVDTVEWSDLFTGTYEECKDFIAKYPDSCYKILPVFQHNSDVGCSEYPTKYRDC